VVHKHAATRLHFDLRLEMNGVLESWAVPKGPSRNPKDKRLAVKVEDHPLEYGDFEGVIPEGNYGAGAVVLWDRGVWVPVEDMDEGFEKGKLLFELRGYKLRGRWTLVKIKKSEKEWLLIKERDSLVAEEGDEFPQDSVLSGLTVEQLKEGVHPAESLIGELEGAGAKRRRVDATEVKPMLADTREKPFSKPGWIFEIKYDGYRMIAGLDQGEASLTTRNGHDATHAFPEVIRALEALPFERLVLDGEVVVHDEAGRPSFGRLQKRARLTRPADIRRASIELPATLYLFDLLGLEGHDVRRVPLVERKAALQRVLPSVGPLRYSDHVEEHGAPFFDGVREMALEGMIAKKADSPYRSGRSPSWIKVRADRTGDFVVVGFTRPKGSRGGFGALHLAAYEGRELIYVGRAGSGFTTAQLEQVREALDSLTREAPPCRGAPGGAQHTWVDPEIVCEVRYREWTEEGLLRHPVFLRFRDDKPARECEHPGTGKREEGSDEFPEAAASEAAPPDLKLTNLDKTFWPEEGYTKGDLLEYYRAIAPWILPYLSDRPVVMTRFPDGIEGKSFFQKDAPGFAPDWIRREQMWNEDTGRELNYFVADDEASLLYIVNLGSIPLHVWASRAGSLEHPDWCILDLDPKEAPFKHVVKIARFLRKLCDEIELPSFVKTSGRSGLHVMLPLGRQMTHEQSRTLGELLARVVAAELPEIATIARLPAQREGKVYVDYLQNGHGKLLVSPFCVRPYPGARVSMPLRWSEVNSKLDLAKYTIQNAPSRMKRLGEDPLLPVLSTKPDLGAALGRLQGKLG
jgi:bifunctional non-homologous end joining protein LigD